MRGSPGFSGWGNESVETLLQRGDRLDVPIAVALEKHGDRVDPPDLRRGLGAARELAKRRARRLVLATEVLDFVACRGELEG